MLINTSLIYSKYKFNIFEKTTINEKYYERLNSSGIRNLAAKTELDYFLSPVYHLKFGLSAIQHRFSPQSIVVEDTELNSFFREKIYNFSDEYAGYIENILSPNDQLKMNLGLRYSNVITDKNKYPQLEPLFLGAYKLTGKLSLKGSYAYTQQNVHLLTFIQQRRRDCSYPQGMPHKLSRSCAFEPRPARRSHPFSKSLEHKKALAFLAKASAEEEGFEPPVRVNGRWFSRPVHSTALPLLCVGQNILFAKRDAKIESFNKFKNGKNENYLNNGNILWVQRKYDFTMGTNDRAMRMDDFLMRMNDFTQGTNVFLMGMSDFIKRMNDFLMGTNDFLMRMNDFPERTNEFPMRMSDFSKRMTHFIGRMTDFPMCDS